MNMSNYKKGTESVWAGEDGEFSDGAIISPVVKSVTFAYRDLDEWHNVSLGKSEGYIYSRNTNPTVHVLEEKIRILEGAEAATSFSTGMGAISNTLFTFLTPGKRVFPLRILMAGPVKYFLIFCLFIMSMCNFVTQTIMSN